MPGFTVDAARGLGGPDWLTARRTAAAEELAAAPVPTAAAEEWRYSPIAAFDLESYRFESARGPGAPAKAAGAAGAQAGAPPGAAGAPAGAAGSSSPKRRRLALEGAAAVVDVLNGRVVAGAGLEALAAKGVTIGPLEAAADGAERLGSVADAAGDYFTLLNDAFARTPIVIDVPDFTVVDGVIAVRHLAAGSAAADFPRLTVRVGRGAEVKVLDMQCSSAAVLSAPVVELDVGPAGRLGYLNVQQHDRGAWQVALHAARVHRDATLVGAVVGLGGAYARTRAETALTGRGATGDLLSAYFGSGAQILDFRTHQDHAAPDTTSNLLYVGAVGDAARSVYTGMIRVRPDARGTNAFQTNRNLKLSEDAWAESVPNLEIENNEVRCSHASTVGPVDADQLYYLESRGVPTPMAQRLIVAGFFDEVLQALPVRLVEPEVRSAIADKLDGLVRIPERAAA